MKHVKKFNSFLNEGNNPWSLPENKYKISKMTTQQLLDLFKKFPEDLNVLDGIIFSNNFKKLSEDEQNMIKQNWHEAKYFGKSRY